MAKRKVRRVKVVEHHQVMIAGTKEWRTFYSHSGYVTLDPLVADVKTLVTDSEFDPKMQHRIIIDLVPEEKESK